MPESSLTAAYKDLTGDVGFFLGWGRGEDNGETAWTAAQAAAVARCVKGGLRNFYFCGHEWSFLHPMASLTLASGESTVELPDDFGGVEGQLTITTSSGAQWWPLHFGGVGEVYHAQAISPDATGRPQACCVEPVKGTTGTQGNRFRLRFWPEADAAYTLRFRYYVHPDYLSGAFPFAYGGPQHAETILESCLAVAEKILDDAATVHAGEFAQRLEVSKELDRRMKPQHLGYNRDLSDCRDRRFAGEWRSWSRVTVNGVEY